jgi:hypothetical protein
MMTGTTEGHIAAVFENKEQAEATIADLRDLGLTDDDLGLVVPEPGRYKLEDHESEEIGRGIIRGAAIGVPIGGLAGLTLAAVGVPGIGVLGLSGLAFSLLQGGFWGAFVGSFGGLVARVMAGAEEEHWCEIPVGGSEILLIARAGASFAEAHQVIHRHGARCFLEGGHVMGAAGEVVPATE